MLAKVIAHGETRAAALSRLRAALEATTVLGVRTNVRFLRWLLAQDPMRDGEMRTDTIGGLDVPAPAEPADRHWAAAVARLQASDADPWAGGWRLNGPSVLRIAHEDEVRSVAIPAAAPDEPPAVRDEAIVHVDVEGQSEAFHLAPAPSVGDALRHAAGAGDATADLVAPMPGRVVAVRVQAGATVRAHEAVIVIEAMKMEHAVTAPTDAIVERIVVEVGQQVARGERLAELGRYHGRDG
jgi:acetyl-CoA/propionyl-CoA carboxylase biotin carboxyl carrier protein